MKDPRLAEEAGKVANLPVAENDRQRTELYQNRTAQLQHLTAQAMEVNRLFNHFERLLERRQQRVRQIVREDVAYIDDTGNEPPVPANSPNNTPPQGNAGPPTGQEGNNAADPNNNN